MLLTLPAHPVLHSNFDIGFKVADDKTADVDKFFADHMAFMKATHSGPAEPKAVSYMVTKTPEPKDPNDPAAGTTGNTIYFMSESYGSMEGCQAHFAKAGATGDILPRFQQTVKDYAVAVSMMVRLATEASGIRDGTGTLSRASLVTVSQTRTSNPRGFDLSPGPNRAHDRGPTRAHVDRQARLPCDQHPL